MSSFLTPSLCYAASSVLFAISSAGHTSMGFRIITPGLEALGGSYTAVAARSNWMNQSAYHLVACILAHKWSKTPGSAWTAHDDAMLIVIVAMNWVGSSVYARLGDRQTTGMLLLRSGLLALGRILQIYH